MGTRGFIGFVVDDTEKIAYNHWDSYPGGLGVDVLTWLKGVGIAGLPKLREQAQTLRVIDPTQSRPTPEDVERLQPYTDLGVGERSVDDWYCLLRRTQGNPAAMLDAGVIEDASAFPGDSLFAEWGYVLDFDHTRFEVYRGFQTNPHKGERFSDRPQPPRTNGYYPVRLVVSWDFINLPEPDEFVRLAEVPDEDES